MSGGDGGSRNGGRARIDGRSVELRPGDTILDAARRAGARIPTLCHQPGLSPAAGCRLCVVEVEGAGRPRAACHTPVEPGDVVRTDTDELEALRRGLLELQLDDGSGRPGRVAADRAAARETELAELLRRYGLAEGAGSAASPGNAAASSDAAVSPGDGEEPGGTDGDERPAVDATHPYLRIDHELCVVCRRCVGACEEWQGQFVYGVAGRGAEASLVYGAGERFLDSPCVACGACVDACPTGAIADRYDGMSPAGTAARTETVCGYCGVGCRVAVRTDGGEIVDVAGVGAAAVNRGHLCAKGRYAHDYAASPDRLTRPLVREDGELRPASWAEALERVADGFRALAREHGPEALGAFTSSRSTNEADYLLQKLFREQLGTNNVDCCARVCHASTALALRTVTGTGAASASYADIDRAGSIVVAGANPTEAHPVVGARIKQAVLRGASLVVIDPRRIELAEYAEHHLQLVPGTNVALFNALAKVLVEEGLLDRAYLEERVEGFGELEAFLRELSAEEAAGAAGVPTAAIEAAGRAVGRAGPTLFVHGLGLSELCQGTASVMTLCNLGMLTGSIGRPGAGMLPLRGQNNVQGNADMGAMPNLFTGYQPLDDPEVRERVGAIWEALPPEEPGLTIPEMIDAAAEGAIRGLWIQGEDVIQSDPQEDHVVEALERLDFLVVQELFLTATARRADVVLPAASTLENDGTYTNGERRVQRVRPVRPPPGEARPDWEAVRDVAHRLGGDWSYAHPGEVMEEIAAVAPGLFGGIRYGRLAGDGLQWPCPEPDHPGTEVMHEDGFLRGRGKLVTVDHAPSPEHDVDGYPYLLVTGRVLDHYNVGTMTRRTPQRELVEEDVLEIHPADARSEGVDDGERVEVESRWGRTAVTARHARRVAPGTLFLSFHFPETHANRLTGPHMDPDAKCPQYKATAVRLSRNGG